MKVPIKLEISPGFYLYLAALFLLIPLPWVAAVLLAGALHEAGHLLALRFMRFPIRSVRLEPVGARILSGPLSDKQELIAASSGPAVGLLLVALFPWFPRVAFCALVQTVFNLIPVMPFDGGRILRCSVAIMLGKGREAAVCRIASILSAVLFACVCVSLLRLSLFCAVLCFLICIRCFKNGAFMT